MPIIPAVYDDISRLVNLVNSAFSGDGGQAGWTHESHLLEGPRINAERMAPAAGACY